MRMANSRVLSTPMKPTMPPKNGATSGLTPTSGMAFEIARAIRPSSGASMAMRRTLPPSYTMRKAATKKASSPAYRAGQCSWSSSDSAAQVSGLSGILLILLIPKLNNSAGFVAGRYVRQVDVCAHGQGCAQVGQPGIGFQYRFDGAGGASVISPANGVYCVALQAAHGFHISSTVVRT